MTNHTIFKTNFQTSAPARQDVLCAICNTLVPKREATAGPYDADGGLTYVCNCHLKNSHQLINSLADYIIEERLELIQRKQHSAEIKEVVPDAWFLY